MFKIVLIGLFTGSLLAATPVAAAEGDSPVVPGSELERGEAESSLLQANDKALVRKQDELLTSLAKLNDLTGRVGPGLSAAFLSWRKYVADECEISAALVGGGLSTATTRRALDCENSLVTSRMQAIETARKCLDGLKSKVIEIGGSACLFRLTPLAHPPKHN